MRHQYMVIRAWVCLVAAAFSPQVPLRAQERPSLGRVLSKIELHYNSLATMRLDFEQTVSLAGRRPRAERGTLSLRRPQQMRWDYSDPEGKLLVGDGDWLHMYNPLTNQVRRIDLRRSADLRAPLSFLLGRLQFRKQFRNLRLEEIGGRTVLVGEGQPGKDSYGRVEFSFDPGSFSLTHIKVTGTDETETTFDFRNEVVNPRLDPTLFSFRNPPGAEVLDEVAGGEGQ
jgi:outer membrane lipoprotein carrier protein